MKKRNSTLLALFMALALLIGAVSVPAALAEGPYRAEFGAQFNPEVNDAVGEWPDLSSYAVEFNPGEETTLSIAFDAPVKFGDNYVAINTNFPATGFGSIVSFKLDGTEVEMGAAYLNNEGIDGGLRLTICNKWNSDIAEQPVEVSELGEFTTLEIIFKVSDSESYRAEFGAQFNPEVNESVGEWPDLSGYAIDFSPGAEATLSIAFDAPVKFGDNYAAINTNFPATGSGSIVSFKLDGAEVEMGEAFLNNEGIDGGLRLTVCNKWNTDIAEQPLDVSALAEFTTLDIVFTVSEGAPAEEEPAATPEPKNLPPFDANGTYHAYLGVQSENYTFRNDWADTSYGANGTEWAKYTIGNNFGGLTGWDGSDPVVRDGVFTDCEIKGNGTYRVELTDFDFGEDEFFNLLFLSTDIPLADNPVTFSDVKVIMNGSTKHTFEKGLVPGVDTTDAKDYYEVHCINRWNADLGGEAGLFGYVMPKNSIALEFTVSGFAYDKAVEEEPAATPEPAATQPPAGSSGNDDDGGFAWWIILVIAGAVVVVVVVVLLMKGKSKKG